MARRKNMKFKLDPEWMFKGPLDFEYNKYTLLGYLQKCEKRLDEFKIYPDFLELSLHFANVQSLYKEKTLLLTNKKFQSLDEEILVKELFPKKPPKLTKEEQVEIDKTISYSTEKLADIFNMAKSIWSVAFDNVILTLKKNKESINLGSGLVIYGQKEINKLIIWEYDLIRATQKDSTKILLNKIYDDIFLENIVDTLYETSRWKDEETLKIVPVFELKTTQNLPMEETLIPMMKRKLLSFIFQIFSSIKEKNV